MLTLHPPAAGYLSNSPLNHENAKTPVAPRLRWQMRVGELLRMLERDGWQSVRTTGSHRVYGHHSKEGELVVPPHFEKELATGTLQRILTQAGLK
jgi:predicted RNA binding protein YcfA (HicA-like mRNA interferase family)